jgi:phytoene synthase
MRKATLLSDVQGDKHRDTVRDAISGVQSPVTPVFPVKTDSRTLCTKERQTPRQTHAQLHIEALDQPSEQSLHPSLEHSFEAARTIMQTQAVSFYQAFKGLPEDRFKAVTAVYAFCRYADDLVDEGGDAALPRLDDLEESIHMLFSSAGSSGVGMGMCSELPSETDGKYSSLHPDAPETHTEAGADLIAPTLPWWPSFVDSVRTYGVQEHGLLMQIQGQRMDADFHDIQSTAELVEYSRLVAGSVGLMLVPILVTDRSSIEDEDFMRSCEELGIAMQITNILRDVGEDLRERNRIYIPRDVLDSHGVTRKQLSELARQSTPNPIIPRNFIALWEQLAQLADRFYLPYQQHIEMFHTSARTPLITAAKLYQAIEEAVRDQSYNCFTKRCYTSTATRLRIVTEIQLRKKEPWKIS